MTEKKYKNTKKNSKQTMNIGQINKIRTQTRGSCTGGFEGGTVGQAVVQTVLTVVHELNAASYRLWFELSLGLAVGCGYSRMKRSRVKTVLPTRLDCAHR